jgi:hypothetical protein
VRIRCAQGTTRLNGLESGWLVGKTTGTRLLVPAHLTHLGRVGCELAVPGARAAA